MPQHTTVSNWGWILACGLTQLCHHNRFGTTDVMSTPPICCWPSTVRHVSAEHTTTTMLWMFNKTTSFLFCAIQIRFKMIVSGILFIQLHDFCSDWMWGMMECVCQHVSVCVSLRLVSLLVPFEIRSPLLSEVAKGKSDDHPPKTHKHTQCMPLPHMRGARSPIASTLMTQAHIQMR